MLIRSVFVLFLKMEEGFSMAVEDLSKESLISLVLSNGMQRILAEVINSKKGEIHKRDGYFIFFSLSFFLINSYLNSS